MHTAAEQNIAAPQVFVVFHSAATLKFDEPLAVAVEQNVRSVLTVMELCDRLPQMQVLVYLSTAYSNADLSTIEERVYPTSTSLEQLLTLVDYLPPRVLAEVTPKLIFPKPNTYTFTKAMAENALSDRARACSYATAIFRPSIVISSLRHPWIENLNGPTGIIVGIGKGVLHVIASVSRQRSDMVPVDIAIDTLIAVAWEVGLDNKRETRVYNCSSCENPMTNGEFKTRVLRGIRKTPFDNPLWYPFGFITDRILNMSTVCRRLQAMNDALKYFMLREWQFSTENVKRLRDRLAPADAAVYNLDPHTIDWEQHCVDFVKGTRKYLLRESDKDVEKAQSRMQKLYIIHRATQCLIIFFVYRLALKTVPAILRTILALRNRLRGMYNK